LIFLKLHNFKEYKGPLTGTGNFYNFRKFIFQKESADKSSDMFTLTEPLLNTQGN
jgi:hypothetical protein